MAKVTGYKAIKARKAKDAAKKPKSKAVKTNKNGKDVISTYKKKNRSALEIARAANSRKR